MSLVDYGDRGVPERVPGGAADLERARGTRRGSRTATYDTLVKQYVAALDLQAQKQIAGKIQTLLLQETPIVIPYFIDGLTASHVERQRAEPDVDRADVPEQGIHRATRSGSRRRAATTVEMTRFILKRVGLALITLWILSADRVLRRPRCCRATRPARSSGRWPPRSAVTALDHQLGTDKPLLTQYWTWISHFVPGRHRQRPNSYQAPVGPMLISALGHSLKLARAGVRDRGAARHPRRRLRGAARRQARSTGSISVVGLSATVTPEFVSGIILILVFGIWLNVLPISATAPPGAGFATQIYHLILPAIPLVLCCSATSCGWPAPGTVEALELGLRAHGDAQGPAARGDDPPPRAAQLAAADDHGRSPPRPGT